MYVADTGDPKAGGTGAGGIQKWVNNGSQWILQYNMINSNFIAPSQATTAAHGETGFEAIAGNVVGGVAYLYAVSYTAGDGDSDGLYAITDTVSATSYSGQTFTEIAAAPGIQAAGTNPDFIFKGVSFAPAAPPVNSDAATNVTATGSTLNGSINPDGVATSIYFQYGTSTAFGQTTGTLNIGSGTGPVPFDVNLTGLSPNTTYYYRLVTVANGVTTPYAAQTLSTPLQAPAMPAWATASLVVALVALGVHSIKRKRERLAA